MNTSLTLACLPAQEMSACESNPRQHPSSNSSSVREKVLRFVDEMLGGLLMVTQVKEKDETL